MMANRRTVFLLAAAILLATCSVGHAIPVDGFGIVIGAGIAGSLSYFEVGVMFPKINDLVYVDVKLRLMSSITWATFVNMETSETVSFHPTVAGVVVSVGTVGPVVNESFRVYGGTDLLLGYSFTPYDNLFYGVGNLIPPNVTFGIWGLFGFEMFTSDVSSIYVQSGGGFKSLLVDDRENAYAVASSWLGSGFGIQMGSRFAW